MNLTLSKYQNNINAQDIADIENKLLIKIPEAMKSMYFQYNGGKPSLSIWRDKNNILTDMLIDEFFPMKYNKSFMNDPDFVIEGIAADEWKNKRLPKNLFPFAMNDISNYYCLDHKNGRIYFFDRDKWDDNPVFEDCTILLNDSFESFLSSLIEEENVEEEYEPKMKKTKKLKLSECGKKLTAKDINGIESKLNITIPEVLKKLYLKHNGGTPNIPIWENRETDWESMEIKEFLTMKYPASYYSEDSCFTVDGIAESEWAEVRLPKNLLPFAIDHGANYFCIDIVTREVYFFAKDIWSENLSVEDNLACKSQLLESSFESFVAHLGELDEDDY